MKKLQTKSIHAGSLHPRIKGAVVTPVFQSSTFEYHGENYHNVGYLRLNNSPNHKVLDKRIAALEEAEATLVTASGMAAISGILLNLLESGDHILVQDCLYGGTRGLLDNELGKFGVSYSVIDVQKPSTWESVVTKNTKAVYVETLTNPLVQLADLEAIVCFAQNHKLVSIIDNTFASPINFRPIPFGFDLVIESCTKYLGGHTDIIAGSISGKRDTVYSIKCTLDHLGGCLSPHDCFLLERGLKTLSIRIKYQNESALRIATYLEHHDAVSVVHYPGLESHLQHQRAKELLNGFGGMISFELKGGAQAAEKFLSHLKLPAVAASLGGVESLIIRPAAAIHSELSAQQREKTGISDALIRFSVGLEDSDDLLADFANAFSYTI